MCALPALHPWRRHERCQAVCTEEDVGHVVLVTVPPAGQELLPWCIIPALSCWCGVGEVGPAEQHSCVVTPWALSSILTPVQAGRDTFPSPAASTKQKIIP